MLQTAELILDFWDTSASHKLAPNEIWVTYTTLANFISMVLNLGWYIHFSKANANMSILCYAL